MSGTPPVLRVTDAVIPESAARRAAAPLSFDLAAGALALITIHDPARIPALGDLLCGLLVPDSGRVEFDGRPWTDGGPAAQADRRAHIGRVFSGTAWIGNLDVDENVILAQMYHTQRPAADLRAAAADLAHRFGLAGLSTGRPAWADARELQVAQWVRAWLAGPRLFVLEEPEADAPAKSVDAFRAALRDALAAGAAAVWITKRPDPGLATALNPAVRLALDGAGAAGWEQAAR